MKILKSLLPEITLKFKNTDYPRVKIKKSEDVFKILLELYDDDTIEYIETVVALFLNRANNTVGWMKLSTGCSTMAIIDSKVLFTTALKCGASGVILSHNHPSGQIFPSEQDDKLTKNIHQLGKLLDLPMLDHLIITKEDYFSYADKGMLY